MQALLVAGRAEPAALAGERQDIFVFTVIAANPGKPLLQVAAIKELLHHFRDDGAEVAVPGLVALLIDLDKGIKVPGQALPQWRGFGLAGTIGLRNHAHYCNKEGVSSNGTPPKKMKKK
jgi:hypothetical protein